MEFAITHVMLYNAIELLLTSFRNVRWPRWRFMGGSVQLAEVLY